MKLEEKLSFARYFPWKVSGRHRPYLASLKDLVTLLGYNEAVSGFQKLSLKTFIINLQHEIYFANNCMSYALMLSPCLYLGLDLQCFTQLGKMVQRFIDTHFHRLAVQL